MKHGLPFLTFLAGTVAAIAVVSPADAAFLARCHDLRHETNVSKLEAAVQAHDRCSCVALQRLIDLTHPTHFNPAICEPGLVAAIRPDDGSIDVS